MNEVGFIDAETDISGNPSEQNFKGIVLQQLSRVSVSLSNEMHGGFFVENPLVIGGNTFIQKKYVGDTREVFANCVESLSLLLKPHFDEIMNKAYTAHKSRVKDLFSEYVSEKKTKDPLVGFNIVSHYKDYFAELSEFLFRNNYLESARYEE